MKPARVLYHLVRADFLERVRRTSFLLTLGFAVYLGYLAFSGTIVMSLGDYRGIYNSAWIGSLMGVVASCFLTLVGFYVVKNSILRDEQTRVGRILATTPMTRIFYCLGKTLSNFAVLAAMVLVVGLASVALQLFRAEDTHVHLWQLLSPLLLLAMPALAFAAALAVLFESIPGLRGGAGNVAYFFLWTALLSGFGQVGVLDKGTPATSLQYFADYSGIVGEMTAMQRQVRAIDPAYKNGASLNIGQAPPAKRFVLRDQPWTPAFVLSRLFWLVAALLTSLLAAVFFHRFDPAREGSRALRRATPAEAAAADEVASPRPAKDPAQLTAVSYSGSAGTLPRLVLSELRLMLQGQKWWWYTVAAGLWLGQLLSPRDAAVACLTVAWLWPLLLWSPMGAREARYFTGSLIFSAPRSVARQMPALWCAGVLVAAATGSGLGVRLLIEGEWHALAAWLAGALFIPSLALALGTWSGGSKLFEALYTVWWYAGPLHHVPGIDFMGTTPPSASPGLYSLFVIVLVVTAYAGRRRQLAYA